MTPVSIPMPRPPQSHPKPAPQAEKYARLLVDTGPVEAVITVDGKVWGLSGKEIRTLKAGRHKVGIIANTYVSQELPMELRAGPNTVRTTLVKATGSLVVSGTGVEDRVSVDGKSYGSSPATISGLLPGEHTLVVEAPGYQTATRTVRVSPGPAQGIKVALERDYGSLFVAATGLADQVSVDGQKYGRSPVEIPRLAAGVHTLTVTAEGYKPATRQVTVAAGSRQEVRVPLERLSGSLYVADVGVPAQVFLDGRGVGAPPKEIVDLTPGVHRVRIEAKGRKTHEEAVEIVSGKTRELRLRLEALTGTLQIDATGLKDRVRVGDRSLGSTPITVRDLPTGPVRVVIEADGYSPFEKQVPIEGDKTVVLTPKLEPAFKPDPQPDGKPGSKPAQNQTGRLAFLFAATRDTVAFQHDAKVWIDRKDPDASPNLSLKDVRGSSYVLDVPPGAHEVEIEAYCSRAAAAAPPSVFKQTVTVQAGQVLSYRVTIGVFPSGMRLVTNVQSFELIPPQASQPERPAEASPARPPAPVRRPAPRRR